MGYWFNQLFGTFYVTSFHWSKKYYANARQHMSDGVNKLCDGTNNYAIADREFCSGRIKNTMIKHISSYHSFVLSIRT